MNNAKSSRLTDIENKLAVTGGEWWGMGQYGSRGFKHGLLWDHMLWCVQSFWKLWSTLELFKIKINCRKGSHITLKFRLVETEGAPGWLITPRLTSSNGIL